MMRFGICGRLLWHHSRVRTPLYARRLPPRGRGRSPVCLDRHTGGSRGPCAHPSPPGPAGAPERLDAASCFRTSQPDATHAPTHTTPATDVCVSLHPSGRRRKPDHADPQRTLPRSAKLRWSSDLLCPLAGSALIAAALGLRSLLSTHMRTQMHDPADAVLTILATFSRLRLLYEACLLSVAPSRCTLHAALPDCLTRAGQELCQFGCG